ncbi:SCAN domain-containing protein 3-like [Mobula hypostoma]|uniref:SCAN domain-containing protein 3-like n=1 Tax=Mobula hypostoma TaxID=723540 RepID=UPI002FC31DA4
MNLSLGPELLKAKLVMLLNLKRNFFIQKMVPVWNELAKEVVEFSGPQLPGRGPVPGLKACATGPRGNNMIWQYESATPFLIPCHGHCWNLNARKVITRASSMSVREGDQLLELANDGGLKSTFDITSLPAFWIKVKAEYPEIATKALKTLLPFPTYICEAEFSAMNAMKTKLQNRLDIRNSLRVSLSPITPRWHRFVTGKQVQGSY